ncbi:hypothetical protein MPL3356_400006 [Mesorhizobium plurifarium]|uniref:Uncharacterized protein n=1 Tax=Mesorhizobium plurifarium TaxID=69974 RepID=A0A090E4C3_MESPL|nr:hypothetical protein MPL3356_400006 [Mesorhizobium plurifarium]
MAMSQPMATVCIIQPKEAIWVDSQMERNVRYLSGEKVVGVAALASPRPSVLISLQAFCIVSTVGSGEPRA